MYLTLRSLSRCLVNERLCFVVKSDLSREKRKEEQKEEQTRLGISDLQTWENNE
jgi:hypothetical protein